ncbi:MAG: hypothetical protein ACYDDV_11710 [Methanoregula sp.]
MSTTARKHLAVFFSLILVLATCFTIGCSTQPPDSPQKEARTVVDFGFRTETTTQEQQAMLSFREITADLTNLQFDTGSDSAVNTTLKNQILFARGIGLDAEGKTVSWTFAVRHNNSTSIVTYDPQGRTIVAWTGIFPQKEIQMDAIITPEDLFLKNRVAIIRNTGENLNESRDLVLSMDNYTLTISGKGATRVMVFDAKTGALK